MSLTLIGILGLTLALTAMRRSERSEQLPVPIRVDRRPRR